MMKYLTIALAFSLVIGCGKSTVQTPGQRLYYTLDELVNTIGVLQDAAITANSQKLLSDSSTKMIVTFSRSSVAVIKVSSSGWKATVLTGIGQLKVNLPGTESPKYFPVLDLLITMIGLIQ